MTDIFHFPDIQDRRDQITIFRTPTPPRDEERAQAVAERFGLYGNLLDMGSLRVIRSRHNMLELFNASDSIRWTQTLRKSTEASYAPRLPEEGQAVELAHHFLHEHDLFDDSADLKSVTYTELSRIERGQQEAETFTIAVHVNYNFTLAELPVFGPGAKMQVTFDHPENVAEAYKFWREPVEDRVMDVMPYERAVERFQHDQAYTDLRESRARVEIHHVQLGYYALPPREVQGFLIPVYAFTGTVSTPALEQYDFTRYLVAVDLAAEDMKRQGALFRAPSAIF
jgi:hypothetical protein